MPLAPRIQFAAFGFIPDVTLFPPGSRIFLALLLFAAMAAISVALFVVYRRRLRSRALLLGQVEATEALIPDSKYVQFTYQGHAGPMETKLHYVQVGKGRDIVLLHGIGASVFVWRFLFPLLQGKYRVTAFDLPGFGKSGKEPHREYGLDAQAKTLDQAFDELGLRHPIIVGSSMGGAIALWMAKLFPFKYKKVVALAPATDSRILPGVVRHFSIATPLMRRALNRSTMRRIVSRVVTRQVLVTDEVVDEYLKPFQDDGGSGIRAFWAATAVLSDRRLPNELRHLPSDVLIIYGTRDLLVSRRSIDKLMLLMPKARLLLHRDGGHHVMEDEPVWTARTLDQFINDTLVARPSS